jgi:hypothetical protein
MEAGLPDDIHPVYYDINPDCSARLKLRTREGATRAIPLTRGGKLGLSYAFRSYEDILDTRFPL